MTDYEFVRSDWWDLLNWHLKINGTRPTGNTQTSGKTWMEAEFAQECNVGDRNKPRDAARTVQYWLDKRSGIVTSMIEVIANALFGGNPAYDPWRLDLRAAHLKAQRGKASVRSERSVYVQRSAIGGSMAPDQPADPHAFAFAVREGVLMRLKGQTLLAPNFLRRLAENCHNTKLVAEMIRPDQDIEEKESLMGKLMSYLVFPAFAGMPWTEDELNRVLDEAGRHLHGILLRKAHDLGIYGKNGARYAVDDDALDSLAFTFDGRLPDQPTDSDICQAMYLSWRDVVRTAVENAPGEDKGYIDILSIFMYAVSYDNGSVRHCFPTL